jgi:hypothetical protein
MLFSMHIFTTKAHITENIIFRSKRNETLDYPDQSMYLEQQKLSRNPYTTNSTSEKHHTPGIPALMLSYTLPEKLKQF